MKNQEPRLVIEFNQAGKPRVLVDGKPLPGFLAVQLDAKFSETATVKLHIHPRFVRIDELRQKPKRERS